MSESQQSPSRVLAKSEQSPRILENSVVVGLLGLSSDCLWTVLGLLGLYSDCSDCLRTARTVLGVHSDYVGECKVLLMAMHCESPRIRYLVDN